MKIIALTFFFVCTFCKTSSYAQNAKVDIVGDDIVIEGKKICTIKETFTTYGLLKRKSYSYEILDINNISRFKSDGDKLFFQDDGVSYVVPKSMKKNELAEMIASEPNLFSGGYNPDYRYSFAKKQPVHKVYDLNSGLNISFRERDIKAPVKQWDYFIIQDKAVIGHTSSTGTDYKTYEFYDVFNFNHEKVASIELYYSGGYFGLNGTCNVICNGQKKKFPDSKCASCNGSELLKSAAIEWIANQGVFYLKGNLRGEIKKNPSNNSPTATPTINPQTTNNSSTTLTTDNKISTQNNTSPSGFTNYSTKTTEKLEAMKKEAVAKSDFDAAAAVKTELDLRKAETELLANKQKELDEKVKAEDFAGASTLQKELKPLKEKIEKKNNLRTEIENAVKVQDFEKAESLKQELKSLY